MHAGWHMPLRTTTPATLVRTRGLEQLELGASLRLLLSSCSRMEFVRGPQLGHSRLPRRTKPPAQARRTRVHQAAKAQAAPPYSSTPPSRSSAPTRTPRASLH